MRLIRGCLTKLVLLSIFGVTVVYAVTAVTAPWAFHIGERTTPLLYWHGSGQLTTKSGVSYPLYVLFYPYKPNLTHLLPREGLRAAGGLRGSAALCTASGVIKNLQLSGTVYGAWSTTEGSLMEFRLLEPIYFNVGQPRGFLDLAGRWNGQELALNLSAEQGSSLRSGLHIEGATATLDWSSYANFEAACARAANSPAEK
jgi:hypothetical protein